MQQFHLVQYYHRTYVASKFSKFSPKITELNLAMVVSDAACQLPYQKANKACKKACKTQQDAGTMPKDCKKKCNQMKKANVKANCS